MVKVQGHITVRRRAKDGADGTSILNTDVLYAISSSNSTAPTSGWTTDAPAWKTGMYIWTKTKIDYTNGTTTYSNPVCISGGKGIESITEQYYLSSSASQLAGGSWGTTSPTWKNGWYVWTRSYIKYTDGTEMYTPAVCVTGAKGEDGKGIAGVTEYYLISASSSGVTTGTSGWSTTVQQPTSAKPYLWNYEKITYTTGDPTTTTPAVIGKWSKDGKSISSITEYYLVSTSKTGVTTSTSGWSTSIPTLTATNKYLWNYEKVTYTEGSATMTTPVIIGVYGDKGDKGDKGEDGKDGADGTNGTNGTNGKDGIQGCILRVTEWASGVQFRNDESLTSGTRYLDIAIVTTGVTTFNAYKCKVTHTSSSSIGVSNTTYWEKMNSLSPVYTPLIMAQNAIFRFAQTNQLVVMKSDGTTVNAAMGGGAYPFWVGAENPGDANFRIDENGRIYANGGEFIGSLVAGIKNGQRVEINPDSKSISIYDASGNECTSIDGNSFSMDDIVPSSSGSSFTLDSDATATSGKSGTVTGNAIKTNEYALNSTAVYTSKPTSIKVTYSGLKAYVSVPSTTVSNNSLIMMIYCSVRLLVRTYSDSACTNLAVEKTVSSVSAHGIPGETQTGSAPDATISVSMPAGYHKIYAQVVANGGNLSVTTTFSGYWKVSSAVTVVDNYISRYFANGFALSKNSDNYFAVVQENGIMNFSMASKGRKVAMTSGVLTVDGVKQLRTVFAGRYYLSGANDVPVLGAYVGTTPSLTRSDKGIYVLSFASGLFTSSNAIISATGYGSSDNDSNSSPIYANVYSIGSSSVTIHTGDDSSENDGGFFLEVKVID